MAFYFCVFVRVFAIIHYIGVLPFICTMLAPYLILPSEELFTGLFRAKGEPVQQFLPISFSPSLIPAPLTFLALPRHAGADPVTPGPFTRRRRRYLTGAQVQSAG